MLVAIFDEWNATFISNPWPKRYVCLSGSHSMAWLPRFQYDQLAKEWWDAKRKIRGKNGRRKEHNKKKEKKRKEKKKKEREQKREIQIQQLQGAPVQYTSLVTPRHRIEEKGWCILQEVESVMKECPPGLRWYRQFSTRVCLVPPLQSSTIGPFSYFGFFFGLMTLSHHNRQIVLRKQIPGSTLSPP